METASVREASARVIAALSAAGRSRTAIKRHETELNAFARFLQARGQDLPAEVDCLDFVAERSGCRLACLREPASSREAQLARLRRGPCWFIWLGGEGEVEAGEVA